MNTIEWAWVFWKDSVIGEVERKGEKVQDVNAKGRWKWSTSGVNEVLMTSLLIVFGKFLELNFSALFKGIMD